MFEERESLTKGRHPRYEDQSSEGEPAWRRRRSPTVSTFAVLAAVIIGFCVLLLYTGSKKTEFVGSQGNLELSSRNWDVELDSNSGSDQDNVEQTFPTGGQASCFVFDERNGESNGVENRLWYFRENYFLNSHHFFWHTYYTDHKTLSTPDRAGEIFYFMHHELVARYITERWSVGLNTQNPIAFTMKTLIPEGYDPHLTAAVVGMVPTPRAPNQYLQDVTKGLCGSQNATVASFVQILNSLKKAIRVGYLTKDDGSKLPITGLSGLNTVAEVSSRDHGYPYWLKGVNYMASGIGFHIIGHILIGSIMDPTGAKHLCTGVMINKYLTLYDPVFFRYHVNFNQFFESVKQQLEPYSALGSDFPLLWSGVKVLEVEVRERNHDDPNQLHTYFAWKEFNARFGLDWLKNESDPTPICQKQLMHKDFDYKIRYDNPSAESLATVRIFLAPRLEEYGNRMSMNDQYRMFFHLDRFTTILKPGQNEIHRSSQDSTLTLPERTWLEIKNNTYDERYCGCGLPHHLLLPKGSPEGMVFDLFVMLTNAVEDIVEGSEVKPGSCQSAPVWCVNHGVKYPDAKPMGYPFDRRPYETARGGSLTYLEDYMEGIGNMRSTQVTIRHRVSI